MPEQKCAFDPSIKTGFLASVEGVVNKTLHLDPVTIKRLGKHQGSVLRVECLEPGFTSWLWIESDGIRLAGYHEGEVDASVKGSLVSFMELAGRRFATFEDVAGLVTEGDEALLADLGEIHKGMELDWEGLVCRYLGDVAGHAVSEGVRRVSDGFQQIFQRSARQVPDCLQDYLQEELQVLPARTDMEFAQSEANALQDRTDELAKRISALEEQIKAKHK
ncbi:ubiquinone biosynthesis accessory factor UbiJ [Endozoicomonas lisbonensis]|uniref:Ubiquinone biosynthesis protein UbiJ n=1 Tax=Endozoicomonas lisbonensis TaxID=3120522 RepID=A0ABV2SEQ9_9GAMM